MTSNDTADKEWSSWKASNNLCAGNHKYLPPRRLKSCVFDFGTYCTYTQESESTSQPVRISSLLPLSAHFLRPLLPHFSSQFWIELLHFLSAYSTHEIHPWAFLILTVAKLSCLLWAYYALQASLLFVIFPSQARAQAIICLFRKGLEGRLESTGLQLRWDNHEASSC